MKIKIQQNVEHEKKNRNNTRKLNLGAINKHSHN